MLAVEQVVRSTLPFVTDSTYSCATTDLVTHFRHERWPTTSERQVAWHGYQPQPAINAAGKEPDEGNPHHRQRYHRNHGRHARSRASRPFNTPLRMKGTT